MADAAFGDDVLGEMPDVFAGTFQRRHLHAAVVVEMHMQRGQRQIVMAMIVLHQPLGEIARRMVVDINQGSDALPGRMGVLRTLLKTGAREIPDDLGAVLVAARLRRGIDLGKEIVFDGDGDPLHPVIP